MRQRAHGLRSRHHVRDRSQSQVGQLDHPDRDLPFPAEAGQDHLRVGALPLAVDDVEVGQQLRGVQSDEAGEHDGQGSADVAQRGHGAREREHAGADDGGDDVHDPGKDRAAAADAVLVGVVRQRRELQGLLLSGLDALLGGLQGRDLGGLGADGDGLSRGLDDLARDVGDGGRDAGERDAHEVRGALGDGALPAAVVGADRVGGAAASSAGGARVHWGLVGRHGFLFSFLFFWCRVG